jgi:hypothetical protein
MKGWMWWDNDAKRTIEEKIALALDHHKDKVILCCYVSMGAMEEGRTVKEIPIKTARYILPHHIWLITEM